MSKETKKLDVDIQLGLLFFVWFVLIPFILGFVASGESVSAGLFFFVWLIFLTLVSLVPIVGFPTMLFVIHPLFLTIYNPAGSEGIYALYFSTYFIFSIIYHIVIAAILYKIANN